MGDLKKENSKIIWGVIATHALVFWFVSSGLPRSMVTWKQIVEEVPALAPAGLAFAVVGVIHLMLLGLLPRNLKESIVHWRLRDPLPGGRAFSRYAQRDSRINWSVLTTLGAKPDDSPASQNRTFYAISKQVENDRGVQNAHRAYLAARDAALLNFFAMLFLPVMAAFVVKNLGVPLCYLATLLVAFLGSAIAAQNYAIRFVENVLAAVSVPHRREGDALTEIT
jgi:hypothetical protein